MTPAYSGDQWIIRFVCDLTIEHLLQTWRSLLKLRSCTMIVRRWVWHGGSLAKSQHDRHIGVCVRKDLAHRYHRRLCDIHYCYLCIERIVVESWNDHCEWHLRSIKSKRCGTITSCHTLVRPGYCPYCLGDESLQRLTSWTRDHTLCSSHTPPAARYGPQRPRCI